MFQQAGLSRRPPFKNPTGNRGGERLRGEPFGEEKLGDLGREEDLGGVDLEE